MDTEEIKTLLKKFEGIIIFGLFFYLLFYWACQNNYSSKFYITLIIIHIIQVFLIYKFCDKNDYHLAWIALFIPIILVILYNYYVQKLIEKKKQNYKKYKLFLEYIKNKCSQAQNYNRINESFINKTNMNTLNKQNLNRFNNNQFNNQTTTTFNNNLESTAGTLRPASGKDNLEY